MTKHFQGLKTQVEQYELELDRQLARMDLKTPLFSRGVTHMHNNRIASPQDHLDKLPSLRLNHALDENDGTNK